MDTEQNATPPVVDAGTGAFDETDGETRVDRGEITDRPEKREFEDASASADLKSTNSPDHAQTAPEVADPSDPESERVIYLPRLLSDEFGMMLQTAEMACLTGTIEIGGEKWTGHKTDLPYDAIVGKEIFLRSDIRSARFTYNG